MSAVSVNVPMDGKDMPVKIVPPVLFTKAKPVAFTASVTVVCATVNLVTKGKRATKNHRV